MACIVPHRSFFRSALAISRKTFQDELMLFDYTEEESDIDDHTKA
jgi:hypothetical protein